MSAPAPKTPRRGIGPYRAAALIAANMIGAGVFTTSGSALSDLAVFSQVALALAAFWMTSLRELLLVVGFLLGLSATATQNGQRQRQRQRQRLIRS